MDRQFTHVYNKLTSTALKLFSLLLLPVTKSCLELIACREIIVNGEYVRVLIKDPAERCDSAAYKEHLPWHARMHMRVRARARPCTAEAFSCICRAVAMLALHLGILVAIARELNRYCV